MSGLANLERWQRGVALTHDDEIILATRFSDYADYEMAICDRNDAAIMLARTAIAKNACRATRNRAMPV